MEGIGFTPLSGLAGGVLIGAAASLLLLATGRIAGISGILGSALRPQCPDRAWRVLFLAGLPLGALVAAALGGSFSPPEMAAPAPVLALAGLLVGFGTQLGSGCTSGHGVCGLARRSKRSLVATLTFMFTGAVTVFVVRHLLGGA